ncbi:hypothetical protein DID88_001382 [Monilinia fructigena]|uniref:Uncharacterized protein n=1 Tax=Monilinia fructigena TaxID=38457 RepID=A0A395IWV2_9HELO|nr:hypothetical protein DID88_001382 [Monilinia fructigena]
MVGIKGSVAIRALWGVRIIGSGGARMLAQLYAVVGAARVAGAARRVVEEALASGIVSGDGGLLIDDFGHIAAVKEPKGFYRLEE